MSPLSANTSLFKLPVLRQFFDDVADRLELADTSSVFVKAPELDELQRFFADISLRVARAERTQRLLDQELATGFNVFHLIDPDENKLSDVLSLLLNPKGSHGQGDLFLRLLFIELKLPLAKNLRDAKVQREAMTDQISNNRRRIDVLIEAPAPDWRRPEVLWQLHTDIKFLSDVGFQFVQIAEVCGAFIDELVQEK
jgi:hypothetical protein